MEGEAEVIKEEVAMKKMHDQAVNRETLQAAMNHFLKKGKNITILPPQHVISE